MRSYSNLPEEIIIHILSRLPAKTVGLCRCVSKPWRAVLSQPNFIKTHLDRSRNLRVESLVLIADARGYICSAPLSDAHHLFDEITITATKVSFADHPDSWIQVYASCDGLLMVGDDQGKNFVLNPVTGEIREVPQSPFALDPHESFTMYGFGYDSANEDYKIVSISYYDTDNECGYTGNEDEPFCTEMFVNLYSLETGTWKRAESSPYDHVVGHVTSGASVDGYIHWLACRKPDYKSVIVAFDLVEEKFSEVPPPSSLVGKKFVFNHLVVLGGCLCIVEETRPDVWMMKEYGVQESWTYITVDNPGGAEIRPLCMLGQEEIVLLKDEEKLVMYNLKEKIVKDIEVHGLPDSLVPEASFVESLVSPHGTFEAARE